MTKYLVLKRSNSHNNITMRYAVLLLALWLCMPACLHAQNARADSSNQSFTLQQCIDYAMIHQPALNQSLINVSIAKATNAISLSGWLPQVGASGSLTHYFQLPTSFEPNTANPNGPPVEVRNGITNTATPGISATQAIFSPALVYAAKSAPLYIEQARQVTDSTKINIVTTVSKSFYSLLLTLEQIDVLKADTIELDRSVTDAYHQYIGGIVDETDYDEATITLNNTVVQLKQAIENITPQYAALKQLMGYPSEKQFNVSFDTAEMIRNINLDTTTQLEYQKRIEYKQLTTAKKLQQQLISYYQIAFLPTVSGFFNYTQEFENNTFSNLFSASYPYSSAGLSLSLPLFTGFARLENVRKAKLQERLLDWSEVNLKSEIYTEYATAMANYKSNLYSFHVMQKNVALAKKVYFIVELQYKQGIVAYLNVITAQSNLITSQVGYINALFQVLSNKIDLERAMGEISY